MKKLGLKRIIPSFTLMELLIVVAIVSIIAAFAIPSYMNYVTQTRVNALWSQAEAAKLEVESQYLRKNVAASSVTVNSGAAEYTTTNVPFVHCITIQGGVVSVVGTPSLFNNKSIWISWTPTETPESLTWTCTYSSDAAPYVTNTSNTCAVNSCQQYSAWNAPTTVSSNQVWYFGTLDQAQASEAFVNNCNTTATYPGCAACYSFSNTQTEQRYMTFSLSNATYNYQGSLGSDPNWNSYSSWAYTYNYTIVTQTCNDQTRTSSSCASTNTWSNDSACN